MQLTSSLNEALTANIIITLSDIATWTKHQQPLHHFSHSHVLFIAINGEAVLDINEREVKLKAHEVYSCLPFSTIGIREASDTFHTYVLFIDMYQKKSRNAFLLESTMPLLPPQLQFTKPERLQLQVKNLYDDWQKTNGLERFRCQLACQELLLTLFDDQPCEENTPLYSMDTIHTYMAEHYTKELTVAKLASLVNLSPNYFAERFKEKYGATVMGFLSELRMQEAKRLLKKGNRKIKEIAYAVGFKDEFYFSRKFKQQLGMTPTAYCKQTKRKIVAYSFNVFGHLLPLDLMPYAAPLHPKWTAFYHQTYREEIPLHLSAYRVDADKQRNLEMLKEEDVNLIIAPAALPKEEMEVLEQKAEVLYLQEQIGWKEQFFHLAEQLGETWEAKQWMHIYEEKAQQLKVTWQQAFEEQTVIVLRMVHEHLYDESENPLFSILYHDLGCRMPEACSCTMHQQITVEDIHALEADTIFILVRQDNETRKHWFQLQQQNSWRQLYAVQANQVRVITSDPWLEDSAHANLRKLEALQAFCP